MADVQPLRALHYDLATAGPLADLIAPPYDVIDAPQRAALAARSPHNVVELDLPSGGDDRYAQAAERFEQWRRSGILVRDEDPALWLIEQRYRGGDGEARTRHGLFARVGIEQYGAGRIRPHERTHPGPKEDRLRLTRATRANLSPIFALYSDPTRGAYGSLASAAAGEPWGEAGDDEGTVHRIWRCANPAAIAAAQLVLAESELLIADGHHRYETARAYAEEIGGEGEHRYVLMCLVAFEDPGLEILATHRLVGGLDDARRRALAESIERDFQSSPVTLEELAPPAGRGPLELGYLDSAGPRRLRLRDQAIADGALADMPSPYRTLDTGVLEALLLKGPLALSDEDISQLRGLGYARDTPEAVELIERGSFDVAFLMRPTPVEQVREIAETGVNMPPKSTYFFPKVPTGLVFNLLA
ncbi:MAG TPA: DUF1015 domain-containing protein [Solirubrobacteraceae bacterium]|jgi:uncharacterized protein (DUF1015 family)